MIAEAKTKDVVTSEELFSQKMYWLNKLSGELPETNLISDYVRHTMYSSKNCSISFELPNNLSRAILDLTKKSQLSIYFVLLSALHIFAAKIH